MRLLRTLPNRTSLLSILWMISAAQATFSGPENIPLTCHSEGLMAYSDDCKTYYECTYQKDKTLKATKHVCQGYSVFSAKLRKCVQPNEADRDECINMMNEVLGGYLPPLFDGPVPLKKLYDTRRTRSNENIKCSPEGYAADPNDCTKFYRCVSDGNEIQKYEFKCADGTAWDISTQTCNFIDLVQNCKSGNLDGRPSNSFIQNSSSFQSTSLPPSNSFSSSNSSSHSSSSTSSTSSATSGSSEPNSVTSPQANMTSHHENSSNTNTNNNNHSTEQNSQNPTSNNSGASTSNQSNSQQDNLSNPSEEYLDSSGKCHKDGYFGDSMDCQKFYRCVVMNDGSIKKYEFKCGTGTVWDGQIMNCNHPTNVNNRCKTSSQSVSNSNENGSGTPENSTQEQHTTSSAITQNLSTKPVDEMNPNTTTSEQTWSTSSSPSSTSIASSQKPSTTSSTSTTSFPQSVSSPTPKPTEQCPSEGFQPDENDCNKFYRCVDDSKGGYTRYEFSCAEGTVWDKLNKICNFPYKVNDSKCGTNNENTTPQSQENQDTTSKKPTTESKPEETSNSFSTLSTTEEVMSTSFSTQSPSSYKPNEQTTSSEALKPTISDNICQKEGFIGDSKDCRKFYRCVDNHKGRFDKYEFKCSNETIWDEGTNSCNYPHISHNSFCHHSNQNISSTENPHEDDFTSTTNPNTEGSVTTTTNKPTSQTEVTGAYTKPSTQTDATSKPSTQTQATSTTSKPNSQTPTTDTNKPSTSHASTTKKPNSNHPHANGSTITNQQTTGSSPFTSMKPTTSSPDITSKPTNHTQKPQSLSTPTDSFSCNSSGYMANPNNCRKFYRCVDDGKGGYILYDFDCGEGTAWDPKQNGCNFENLVESCKHQNSSTSAFTESVSTTTPLPSTAAQTTNTMSSSTTNGVSSSSTIIVSSVKPTSNNPANASNCDPTPTDLIGTVCTKAGYMADPNDCRKFYRCVSTTDNKYTRFDFTCGPGTAWDENLLTCNYESAVQRCKSQDTSSSSFSQTTPITTISSPMTTDGTTLSTTSDPNAENQTTTFSTTTTMTTENSTNLSGETTRPTSVTEQITTVSTEISEPNITTTEMTSTATTEPSTTTNSTESVSSTTLETTTDAATSENPATTSMAENSTQEATTSDITSESSTSENPTTTSMAENSTQEATTSDITSESSTSENPTTTSMAENSTQEATTSDITSESSTSENPTTTSMAENSTQEATTSDITSESSTSENPTTTSMAENSTQEATTSDITSESSTSENPTTTSMAENSTQEATTSDITSESSTSENPTTTSMPESTTIVTTTDVTTESNTNQTTTEMMTTVFTTTQTSQTTTEGHDSESKPCPNTSDDQDLFVCPTGFRRHPSKCGMFYQCSRSPENLDLNIVTFSCPNGTVYNEKEIRCSQPNSNEKECLKNTLRSFEYKNSLSENMVYINSSKPICPRAGYFALNNEISSPVFIKCSKSEDNDQLSAEIQRCPPGYSFWNVSNRCELNKKLFGLQKSKIFVSSGIPIEWSNLGA